MSDSPARFSWSVPWLRLTYNVGSSWFPPHEDVLNDHQYTTRRLSALGLFSVLTLPFFVGGAFDTQLAIGIALGLTVLVVAFFDVLARIVFLHIGVNMLHVEGDDLAQTRDFLLQSLHRLGKQIGKPAPIQCAQDVVQVADAGHG